MTPIYVGNFEAETERADVVELLRKPTPKFWPYCVDDAIDLAFSLTGGNPYLLQLLGYYVVQGYNNDVKANNEKIKKKEMDKNKQRDPVFTPADIERAGHAQRVSGNE